jgi:hypothetical protein
MKERVGNRGRGLRGQCAPGWRQASSRFSILAELTELIFGLRLRRRSFALVVISVSGKRETQMKNPWTKQNPLLSMWLSGANAVAGSARSRATAEAKRQAATMMTTGAKQIASFWSAALTAPARPKKRKRR